MKNNIYQKYLWHGWSLWQLVSCIFYLYALSALVLLIAYAYGTLWEMVGGYDKACMLRQVNISLKIS